MNKRIVTVLLSSLLLTAGCAAEKETTTSTTDIIAKEARQNKTADLIRVGDRVYELRGKDTAIEKKDLMSYSTVNMQINGKQALVDRTATDWKAGTTLYQTKKSTGTLYVFKGNTAYRYQSISES